jgi:tetratricopeptide (TPR) repeat protein
LPGPRIELARLNEELGDKAGAQRELIEAVTIDPHNPRALAALGKLREESGDTTQALTNYQRSLAYNRNQPEVAARVAALSGAMSPGPVVTPANGTRTVNINNTTPGAVPPTLLR